MKKYKVYKDSGVEWIGEIPEHWEVKRMRYLFDLSKGLTITKANLEDNGVFCVNYGEIHSKYGFEVDTEIHQLKCVNESYLTTNKQALINSGDFIFADTSEDLKGSGNFTYLKSNNPIFAGYHTIIARPKSMMNSRFFAYCFHSDSFRNQIRTKVKGIKVFSITQAILKRQYLWLPDNTEQQKIVAYLDHKTQKIHQLITLKEQKIVLLEEKRTALINQVVTQGLDPEVPMKDSGVDWIREIPKHWEVKKLKYLGDLQNGISKGADYFGSGYPFVNYSDIYKNEILPLNVEGLAKSTVSDRQKYSVLKGDIFFTRTSESKNDIGVASICYQTIKDSIFSGFAIRFRKKSNRLDIVFSRYYFQSYFKKNFIESKMNIVTRSSLSQEVLNKLPVILPPLFEQSQIGKYLDHQTKKIDNTIQKEQQKINLLKEYRQSLISSIVTGKIKVD